MAVYTTVSRDALRAWLQRYDAGALRSFEGIASGIENSNYFVTTDTGRYVLTIFERLDAGQLAFHVGFMHHLALRSVPCPDPVADREQRVLGTLEGKPAAMFTRLPGQAAPQPRAGHCAQVGAVLARMHAAALGYRASFDNPRGIAWWREAAAQVLDHLSPGQRALLVDEIECQHSFADTPAWRALPRSAVHADLFRDNVLFEDAQGEAPRLSGVIDFWFAGVDTWLFDLAVAANDWCIEDAGGEFDEVRLQGLIDAYGALRPPTAGEREAWPMALRAAALRFWLSRLSDLHQPRPAQLGTPKDPGHFERILRLRRSGAPPLH